MKWAGKPSTSDVPTLLKQPALEQGGILDRHGVTNQSFWMPLNPGSRVIDTYNSASVLTYRAQIRQLADHESGAGAIRASQKRRIHSMACEFGRRLSGESILGEFECETAQRAMRPSAPVFEFAHEED
jgi:hypothetical protein